MTDEEIKAHLAQNPALAGLIEAAFQSGYRAGLKDVRNTFVEIRRNNMAVDACELFGRLLDAKLKEQP